MLRTGRQRRASSVVSAGPPQTKTLGFTSARSCYLIFINFLFMIFFVIQTLAAPETERFFATGKSRRLPPNIFKRAAMRLMQLDGATRIEDLRLPPSNRLEALVHDRAGQWSIRINEQWRVCFRFKNGDAFDVEIVDYH